MLSRRTGVVARRAISVTGLVQGVGFRPFVHGLASRLGLRGFVRNQTGRVHIEVEGEPAVLDRFVGEIATGAPAHARIDRLASTALPLGGDLEFRIAESDAAGEDDVVIGPDLATCADCLRELFDPGDRRHGYAFLNCTSCGPRFTIVTGVPYDRARTTMAGFELCADCRAEYLDPRNRRFHAQPTACPACGPRLRLLDGDGRPIAAGDPLAAAAARLQAGAIGAIKGLGGFHLACDARAESAVAELRRRKQRDEKPFAVMVADLAAAERLARISPEERALLEAPSRPIVLLARRADAETCAAVAPGMSQLGVMLAYTPLHHLLLRAVGAPLVMTSGNRSDEPIAFDDGDAIARLSGVADLFLTHDRAIHTRSDDSVARICGKMPLWLRRSRGLAPLPLALPQPLATPTLALGGALKSTFALGAERRGILSHHLGDLEHYPAYLAYGAAIDQYQRAWRLAPRRLIHDLHPDYASTRYAAERAAREPLELIAVQHHHAHLASCLAEHGASERVIGVIFDGAGLGTDGAIWGGEFLVGDAREAVRAAHLAYVPMPGGGRAIREPWRMALAHLRNAGCEPAPALRQIAASEQRVVEAMLERRVNAPPTSSIGRLFDAAAAIAGAGLRASFEGQAAMRLEALASEAAPDGHYPFALGAAADGGALPIDPAPLLRELAGDARRGVSPQRIARRFHSTIVEMIAAVCARLRGDFGL